MNVITLIIVFCLSAIAFYYGYVTHSSFVRADEWRFIEIYLMPVYDGTFTWRDLFSDHHAVPLDGVLFILNALWFDLSGDLFFYVGIVCKILFFIMLVLLVRNSFEKSGLYYILTILLLGTVWFSLKSQVEYAWPLVTRANLWFLLYLYILYLIDLYLKNNDKNNKILAYIFIASFALIIINKDIATLMLGAVLSITVVILILKDKKQDTLKLIFALVIVFVFYKLFWYGFGLDNLQQYQNSIKLDFDKFSFIAFFDSYALALLSGLVKIEFLKQTTNDALILSLGYFVLIIYTATILYAIKNKIYVKTLIPLAFMIFPLFYILGVLLFRYMPVNDEINWLITSPRFIKIYEVGIIGMFWNLILLYDKKQTEKKPSFILYAFIVLVVVINVLTITNSLKNSKSIVAINKNVEGQLLNYQGEQALIPKWARGSYFSDEKLEFLKKHKLNIFSENYAYGVK